MSVLRFLQLQHLRESFKLPSVAFGFLTVALIWWGAFLLNEIEMTSSRRSIASDTANLALVFEQNVIRSLNEIDKSILYLRHAHERARDPALWPSHIRQAFATSDMTFQLAIIDAKGRLLASDRGPQPPQPIDLSDREHFRVHAFTQGDTIYVSKPVMGRVSKKWSVQVTRRFSKPDGTFDGVIVASLDPEHFSQVYRSINLGAGGSITLVGLDGVVRASGGLKPDALGTRLADGEVSRSLRQQAEETIFFKDSRTGAARIASTRWVTGYPLAVVVAADEFQPDGTAARNGRIYLASAGLMSVLVLLALVLVLRRSARLSETRRELQIKSQQHAVTLENMTQGILMVEGDGTIGFMNEKLYQLLGLPPRLGQERLSYRDLIEHLDKAGEFSRSVEGDLLHSIRHPECATSQQHYERERPDGTVLEVRTRPIPGGGFVKTLTDITKRRRAERTVIQLASKDSLTGLANRVIFRRELEVAIGNIESSEGFALHMVDLDRFKPVNDTFGHPTGDLLLKAVADRLRSCVRGSDLVARLGGDEFAVIQHGATSEGQCTALARRLCAVMAEPFTIDGHVLSIGASVGVAMAPTQGKTVQELVNAADLALYAAKSNCRGTVAFFNDTLHAQQCARRALETDLRLAIDGDQFELHYQPIVSVASNDVTAYEALLRWRHPERGNVPPLDFIPLAEETGLIRVIGAWVIKKACEEMAQRSGTARVAINLSPVQFRDRGLVSIIETALAETGLAPERLEIEITESTLMQDNQLTQQHLASLRALGVHITMDDFGTGYSALSYLMNYPIQTIKIDRSFVAKLGETASSEVIIRTITSLANNLGMATTAEGVERKDQLDKLREIGCSEAQGYLFSKPLPAADILPPRGARQLEPRGKVVNLRAVG